MTADLLTVGVSIYGAMFECLREEGPLTTLLLTCQQHHHMSQKCQHTKARRRRCRFNEQKCFLASRSSHPATR